VSQCLFEFRVCRSSTSSVENNQTSSVSHAHQPSCRPKSRRNGNVGKTRRKLSYQTISANAARIRRSRLRRRLGRWIDMLNPFNLGKSANWFQNTLILMLVFSLMLESIPSCKRGPKTDTDTKEGQHQQLSFSAAINRAASLLRRSKNTIWKLVTSWIQYETVPTGDTSHRGRGSPKWVPDPNQLRGHHDFLLSYLRKTKDHSVTGTRLAIGQSCF
jgi:hypothetical protein